ncbi:MAG: UbiA family prenyltransferase [Candidatus Micrarchaeia archaeon]
MNIKAWLKLTRIEHSLMLAIAVVTAEILSGFIPINIMLLSLIAPWLISMGAFAINDYYDIEADRTNKRFDRPLVNGSIKAKSAFNASILFFVVGVAFSVINAYAFSIALIFAVLAFLYSYKLKDTLLIGNIYIAFTMVIPFIYGALINSTYINLNIIIISLFVFLAGLAREIHGMVRDYEGDKKARSTKNLVDYIGTHNAAIVAAVLYLEAILLSLYLFFFLAPYFMNIIYIIPIIFIDIILLYVSIIYLKKKVDIKKLLKARNLSLGAMLLALLVLFLSSFIIITL